MKMRKSLVIANWKMNGTADSAAALLDVMKQAKVDAGPIEVVVLAPYLFLPMVRQMLMNSSIKYGAQNVSQYKNGAYTGEISAAMLREFSCDYVCVGHSERRVLFDETNELVAEKWVSAQLQGLTPILCVGETLAQRKSGDAKNIIKNQLHAVLKHGRFTEFCDQGFIIAYEPVWAIGTGLTPTPEDAQAIHVWIREQLAAQTNTLAEITPIIYGGSVNPENAEQLFDMSDIDGSLVGGASLDADKFIKVIQLCNSCYYSYT